MKRIMVVIAVFWLCGLAFGYVHAGDPLTFQGVDVGKFTDVRMNYAKGANFSPMWRMNPDRKKILEALGRKEWESVKALAADWLASVPVDADMHEIRSIACILTGDLEGFFYHRHFFHGLLASIAASGDGRSPETAMKVISVHEEYDLLRPIRAEVVQQSLIDGPEGPVDKMECTQGGNTVVYYFDVAIPMTWIRRNLGQEKN